MEILLLLLVIIAITLLVIASRSRNPTTPRGFAAIFSRPCPSCRTIISHRATHCPHCGHPTGWEPRKSAREDRWERLRNKKDS
jgi:hypothetical protein